MSLEIVLTDYFKSGFKKLSKRHKSLADDLESFIRELRENPDSGVEIIPHVRKVRMAIKSKGRGKSGGARVITYDAYVSEKNGTLYLVLIYDKANTDNVKKNVIEDIIKNIPQSE